MNSNAMTGSTRLLAGALLLAGMTASLADDTDIFYLDGGAPGTEPMVMFSLDYRPNLGSSACGGSECDFLIAEGYLSPTGPYTFFDVLRAALQKVMDPLEGIQVGLMLNHDYRSNCAGPQNSAPKGNANQNCSNGGYIARGFRSLQRDDANGAKAEFHAILAAMPTPGGNQSHSYQGKELFFELYRYLAGLGVYNGRVGFRDYAGNLSQNLDVNFPDIAWDTRIMSGSGTNWTYQSPLLGAGACSRIFTVNMMFFVSNQENDSDNEIRKSVAQGGMGLSGNQIPFPSVIQWLFDSDLADGNKGTAPNLPGKHNVTSYFMVDPRFINKTTTDYARAGGTGVPLPLSEDPQELVATLSDIFKQILSVSTTFVAASVPVNVFNRAEVVDNVYIALFQPDENLRPNWTGNLKKLRVAGLDETNPVLVDALGDPAIAADGRIRFEALTFWTDQFQLPPPNTDAGEVDGRDGRSVARGGAGQRIPGFLSGNPGLSNTEPGARRLFFDDGGSLRALNADNATATLLQADLGAASTGEALDLLKYVRGFEVDDNGNVTGVRNWLMGSPLHSRPLPLNYGGRGGYSDQNQAIFIAVAGNDGFLRLVRNTTTGGQQSGQEVWAFMPRAVMDRQRLLSENASGIRPPYYLVDSSPVAWLDDANGNGSIDADEDAWLFVGMRRGGRGYYALDVSDPENPALMWHIDHTTPGFAELGYTFSEPRIIKLQTASGVKPALIFGGGYDLNKDTRGVVGSADSMGNAIYIVDAETGTLIWKGTHPDLVDSIPSTVAILDADGDGIHDRAYVGDTGGNVWRADFSGVVGSSAESNWELTLLARLGRHGSGAGSKPNDRRFFHRPDIVQSRDQEGPFDAVIIGSGNRPDPLDSGGTVNDWAYMLKDRRVAAGPASGSTTAITHANLGDVTNTCLVQGGVCEADLSNGWRLGLTGQGEKALATPLTIANVVYFTTYLPPGSSEEAAACAPSEGGGRLYAVALRDAAAVNNYNITTEEPDRFTDLASRGIPAEVVSLPPSFILRPDLQVERAGGSTRLPTYWYESEDSDL